MKERSSRRNRRAREWTSWTGSVLRSAGGEVRSGVPSWKVLGGMVLLEYPSSGWRCDRKSLWSRAPSPVEAPV